MMVMRTSSRILHMNVKGDVETMTKPLVSRHQPRNFTISKMDYMFTLEQSFYMQNTNKIL